MTSEIRPWLSPTFSHELIGMLHLFSDNQRHHGLNELEVILLCAASPHPSEILSLWQLNLPAHCYDALNLPNFWVCVHPCVKPLWSASLPSWPFFSDPAIPTEH